MDAHLTQADLNNRLVEAVVKLRLRDCKRTSRFAAVNMEQAQRLITNRLLTGVFCGITADPLSDLSLALIEGEIEGEIVQREVFVALACLNYEGAFDPDMYIALKYVDPDTRQNAGRTHHIRSIGQAFPFTLLFEYGGPFGQTLSREGQRLLRIHAAAKGSPSAEFVIAPVNAQGRIIQTPPSRTLPAGWALPEAEL